MHAWGVHMLLQVASGQVEPDIRAAKLAITEVRLAGPWAGQCECQGHGLTGMTGSRAMGRLVQS
jgi:hypothetical protein